MDKRGNQAINCEVKDCMFNEHSSYCTLTGVTVKAEGKNNTTICGSYIHR